MNKFSKDLIESLTEACEHAEGKPTGVRVHVVEAPEAPNGNDQGNTALPSPHAPRRSVG